MSTSKNRVDEYKRFLVLVFIQIVKRSLYFWRNIFSFSVCASTQITDAQASPAPFRVSAGAGG